MQTTEERLVRGTVAAYVRHGAGLAAGLIVTPLLVRGVGSEQYGLWVVLQSVLSYVALLDVGLGPAVTNRLAALTTSAKKRTLEVTYATTRQLYKLLGIGLTVIGLVAVASLPALFQVSSSTAIVLGLLVCSTACGFLFMPHACLLMAKQRFDVTHGAYAAGSVIYLVGATFALFMGLGLLGVAASFLAGSITTGWLQLRASRQESVLLAQAEPDLGAGWRLVNQGFLFFVCSLAWQLVAATDSLVIGARLGIVHVARYAPTFRIVEMVGYVVLMAVVNLRPVLAAAAGREDRATIERLFFVSTRISLLLAIPAFFLTLVAGPAFVRVWVGSSNYPGYSVLVPLCLFMLARAISAPSANVLAGLGKLRLASVLTLAEGILNLALSVIWVDQYGLKGVAWATLTAHAIVGAWALPAAACRATGLQVSAFLRGALLPPIVSLAPVSVSGALLVYFFPTVSLRSAAWSSLALGLVSICSLWGFGLSGSQRTSITSHLASFFSRRRSA